MAMNTIGGVDKLVNATPTISTSAYASGDLVGTKMEFMIASGLSAENSAYLSQVVLLDKAAQGSPLDLIVFSSDPVNTTFTDNAALAIDDADLDKVAAVVSIIDYVSFVDNAVADVHVGRVLQADEDGKVYACLVARAAPIYGSTSDLTVRLGVSAN